ncbi:hypothetical protein TNCV_972411 [Trichonephila clavipes]|nr:hypothetical protein TNCV_972411 [Trichonephila clavipes]
MSHCSAARGDEPRNFEPWSSDEDNLCASTLSPSFHTVPTGERLSLDIFNGQSPPLHGISSTVLGSNSGHTGHNSVSLKTRLPPPLP